MTEVRVRVSTHDNQSSVTFSEETAYKMIGSSLFAKIKKMGEQDVIVALSEYGVLITQWDDRVHESVAFSDGENKIVLNKEDRSKVTLGEIPTPPDYNIKALNAGLEGDEVIVTGKSVSTQNVNAVTDVVGYATVERSEQTFSTNRMPEDPVPAIYDSRIMDYSEADMLNLTHFSFSIPASLLPAANSQTEVTVKLLVAPESEVLTKTYTLTRLSRNNVIKVSEKA